MGKEVAGVSYVEDSLVDGERVVGRFSLHWVVWLNLVAPLLLSLMTAGLLLPLAVYVALRIWTIEMGVTTRRVIFKSGIVSRRSQEMSLSAVETVELDQGVVGRVLGYGTVSVTGRGRSDVVLARVRRPLQVKRQIEAAVVRAALPH